MMTKKELWERLAKMKGQFCFIMDAVRHKRKRTLYEVECCPLSALVRGKRTNDPAILAGRLDLPLDFALGFATAADNHVAGLGDSPGLQRLRRKLLRTLGLKEST